MPQDGVFSTTFTVWAAKLSGVRVVCIDHGNLALLNSRSYRMERTSQIATKHWSLPRTILAHLRYRCYWPSLKLIASFGIRHADHFLIPGVAGDGVEENCKRLGIPPNRVTRFASMIDTNDYVIPDVTARVTICQKKGIPADSIIISIVCRLAIEKGLDIALEGISKAFSAIPKSLQRQIRIIIAGDGPLRKHLEEEISRRGFSQNWMLWGETSSTDIKELLVITDIFLYTSTRGACFSMSVLEAMASSCAVVATTEPISNAHLLAEGRGIAIPSYDTEQIGMALIKLVQNPNTVKRWESWHATILLYSIALLNLKELYYEYLTGRGWKRYLTASRKVISDDAE